VILAGSIFDPAYRLVGLLLAVLYVPLHSLGLAIIVLTGLVMFVQLPLIAKQTRSMIMMQRVQPEIKKLQQKYKDDRQKQNEELLKFYQENKINPLAGCLPILVTLPIGIAVLDTFRRPGIQYHIPRTGTFTQLYVDICGKTSIDPKTCGDAVKEHAPSALHFLGLKLNLSAASAIPNGIGSALPYLVLLLLVIVSGWYQVRQTQARQAKSGGAMPNAQMQAVTKIMPVFFGVISYGFNAATTLYFLISNVWRIGQQHFVLNKMYEEEHGRGAAATRSEPVPGTPTPPTRPKPGAQAPAPPPEKGSENGSARPSPNAARRKKKKRKR
jgi:YidC/Oxa1 family membrane protein insertase